MITEPHASDETDDEGDEDDEIRAGLETSLSLGWEWMRLDEFGKRSQDKMQQSDIRPRRSMCT